MKIRPLSIDGAWEITPVTHGDSRGAFLEWFRADHLAAEIGYALQVAQINTSVSAKGVVRGIHFADVPPGQAKYVGCSRGAVLDVVVDLRVGSPTFGRWEAVRLDDVDRRAVFLSEGLGHGFCSLTDDATVMYLCSQPYRPTREHTISPLDADLGVEWPVADAIMSPRDAAAPSLASSLADGTLPKFAECRDFASALRAEYDARS